LVKRIYTEAANRSWQQQTRATMETGSAAEAVVARDAIVIVNLAATEAAAEERTGTRL
jgi:hypothetical protein